MRSPASCRISYYVPLGICRTLFIIVHNASCNSLVSIKVKSHVEILQRNVGAIHFREGKSKVSVGIVCKLSFYGELLNVQVAVICGLRHHNRSQSVPSHQINRAFNHDIFARTKRTRNIEAMKQKTLTKTQYLLLFRKFGC